MRWPFAEVCEQVSGYAGGLYDALRRETRDSGVRALVAPVEPFNRSKVLSPFIAGAAIAGLVMLSGVAVAAVVTAAAALAAMLYLLTRVFGYEISLAMPGMAT